MYEQLKANHMFVVKINTESFHTKAPDVKLEQTIKRSKNSAGGIISQTRQSAFVSEWELVYHEILAINNSFSEITKLGKLNDSDLNLHHVLSGGYSFSCGKSSLL